MALSLLGALFVYGGGSALFNSPMWNPMDSAGFIFDWDGVLAETKLDFSPIREKYFGGKEVAILEEMKFMGDEERDALKEDIKRLEMDGASSAMAVPGGHELVSLLDERSIPWSVVSRNCPDSIYLAAKTIGFSLPKNTFHRDSGHVKPSPEALWMASDAMGVSRGSCTVIGDFVYDLLGARRAGMRSILVERGPEKWSHWADGYFPRLMDFLESLSEGLELIPWEYHRLNDTKGLDWLMSAWDISVKMPSYMSKDDVELAFKLAAMGVGSFVASKEPLSVDLWWKTPWLSAEDLDRPQWIVLRRLLCGRYPMVTISYDGKGVPLEAFRDDPERKLGEVMA